MDSRSAIFDFKTAEDLSNNEQGNLKFNAIVDYESNVKNVVENAVVTITQTGYDDAVVSIEEVGELDQDIFHLQFRPKFQKYSFDNKKNALIVEGSSPKMHGKYVVTIRVKK